jgi:hypothetical protein
MNKYLEKQLNMISYKQMRIFYLLVSMIALMPINLNAEYEMHIPNCTQKGVENCGGFLFDNETGDVLFCGSENCVDLKLPKSWRTKQEGKQSKQDQIIEMLSNIQVGTISTTTKKTDITDSSQAEKKEEKKSEAKEEKKPTKKAEKCDKEKKSLCKGSGGMQLGGTKMKLKKPKKSE